MMTPHFTFSSVPYLSSSSLLTWSFSTAHASKRRLKLIDPQTPPKPFVFAPQKFFRNFITKREKRPKTKLFRREMSSSLQSLQFWAFLSFSATRRLLSLSKSKHLTPSKYLKLKKEQSLKKSKRHLDDFLSNGILIRIEITHYLPPLSSSRSQKLMKLWQMRLLELIGKSMVIQTVQVPCRLLLDCRSFCLNQKMQCLLWSLLSCSYLLWYLSYFSSGTISQWRQMMLECWLIVCKFTRCF